MQVRIEEVSPVEKKLVVEVPWTTVSGKLGDAYRELGKNVQLKGFRRGKVPRSVLERMFGQKVKLEVLEQIVRESFIHAATEHNLDAVSEPKLDVVPEVKKGEPVSFEAIVEVKGEVVAENYDGMELTQRPVKVADSEIDAAVEQLRRQYTEFRPIEGRDSLSDSDMVSIALKGTLGEHQIDRPQLTVDLGDSEHEPLPGLREAIIGLKIDTQDHTLELTMPAELDEAEVAGKTATLTLSVLEAREKEMPALDDEFAKDTGKAETLADLRKAMGEELADRQKEEIANETRQAALAELVKRNQIPVASSLVDRVVHNKFHRLQKMLGIDDHNHDHHGLTPELQEKLREDADDEVRGQLLIEAVADKENIEVTDEDLDARITRAADMQGHKPAKLRADMDRDGRLDNLRFQLRHEKTLDLLVSRATVTEKEPEPAPAPTESASETEPTPPAE